jgi:natural product precursor
MKTKSFGKKLALNKKTVANLENKEMQRIYGGATEKTICFSACVSDCLFCDIRTYRTLCCP